MMFDREDWSLFRNLSTLSQKAGVPQAQLRKLVVKELVDNALDASGGVRFGKEGNNTYWVQDDGAGIPLTPGREQEHVARLFSIARPLTSSKIVRLPVRGALGNGLRVVVGCVLASGGTMEVETGGRHFYLRPLDNGTTVVSHEEPSPVCGTRITIHLGDSVPSDRGDLLWAQMAKLFSYAEQYKGKTSPWWYDSDSFYELLQSAGNLPLGRLVELFHGIKRPNEVFSRMPAGTMERWGRTLSREEADEVLARMRELSKPIAPSKIGKAGSGRQDASYRKVDGVLDLKPGRGSLNARLPYVVEVWSAKREEGYNDDTIQGYVNGTPITGELRVFRNGKTKVSVFGCGLHHYVTGVSSHPFSLVLNITTPYMPITTDGKEPDFSRYLVDIQTAISRSTRTLKSEIRRQQGGTDTQKAVVLRYLRQAIAKASDNGRFPYSLRQLFYAERPFVLQHAENGELDYNHFARIITDYEAEYGDLRGMYRAPRGYLYHPHEGREIPLGTQDVDSYERPDWTFNKILYIEKEGFVRLLRATGWAERNDCALMTGQGFASRAVRDALDLLGDTGEELTFFCIHDADASGTLIYEKLQEGTKARAARKVRIINLGLEPWEAIESGLQIENFTRKGKGKLPVAGYVKDQRWSGRSGQRYAPDGGYWHDWLQEHRVELNAFSSGDFLRWLDDKMEEHGVESKVIPPEPVLRDQLVRSTHEAVRERLMREILAAANLEQQVADAMEKLEPEMEALPLVGGVREGLERRAAQRWDAPVQQMARELAAGV